MRPMVARSLCQISTHDCVDSEVVEESHKVATWLRRANRDVCEANAEHRAGLTAED